MRAPPTDQTVVVENRPGANGGIAINAPASGTWPPGIAAATHLASELRFTEFVPTRASAKQHLSDLVAGAGR